MDCVVVDSQSRSIHESKASCVCELVMGGGGQRFQEGSEALAQMPLLHVFCPPFV